MLPLLSFCYSIADSGEKGKHGTKDCRRGQADRRMVQNEMNKYPAQEGNALTVTVVVLSGRFLR